MSTIITIGAITAGVGALGGATMSGINAAKNARMSRIEQAKARRLQQQIEDFEKNRQPVINQADKIRAMKGQVFNEAANLGVAMQATNLKIAETDKALANTLDTIAAMGPGAGNATALAQMAAASKAEVSAGIEAQELENQKLRIAGEAKRNQIMRDLEQTALAEEVSAYDRQETRDISQLNRLTGLEDRALQAGIAFDQMAQQNMSQLMGDITNIGTSMLDVGMQGGGEDGPDLPNWMSGGTSSE